MYDIRWNNNNKSLLLSCAQQPNEFTIVIKPGKAFERVFNNSYSNEITIFFFTVYNKFERVGTLLYYSVIRI